MMTKCAIWLAAAILLLPTAQGHASPDPIDVDEHLLADDADDSYAYYDGFDLQDLFVREAYVEGQEGLTFRMIIYGGPAPVPVASEQGLELDITAGGSVQTFQITSSDGLEWSGDMTILESALEDGEEGVEGSLQVFVPLADLGVTLGDTVGPFEWRSYADDDLRDIAPGGRPVPGTNGAEVIEATSTVKQETLTLDGPIGYTQTTVTQDGDNVNLTVENLITVIGQHITLDIPDPEGWTIERTDTNAEPVDPGVHPTFGFVATAGEGAEMFTIDVLSDLGGRESLTIHPPAHMENGGGSAPSDGDAPEEESPSPVWLLVAAIAIALVRRQG